MIKPKNLAGSPHRERRSGLNRRWIKEPYQGEERRSGRDRRSDLTLEDLPVPGDPDTQKTAGFEKLLVSNTIQLETVIRLLLKKGVFNENELLEMLKIIQAEYRQTVSS